MYFSDGFDFFSSFGHSLGRYSLVRFRWIVGSIQITCIRHPLHKADREDGIAVEGLYSVLA